LLCRVGSLNLVRRSLYHWTAWSGIKRLSFSKQALSGRG
jgi:hypothetical protein